MTTKKVARLHATNYFALAINWKLVLSSFRPRLPFAPLLSEGRLAEGKGGGGAKGEDVKVGERGEQGEKGERREEMRRE